MGDGIVRGSPHGWKQDATARAHFCVEQAATVTELHDVSLLLLAGPCVVKRTELESLTSVLESSKMPAVIRHSHILGNRRELR